MSRYNGMYSTDAGTPVILKRTRCAACGFSVYNVLWSEHGEVVAYGWMTGQVIPVPVTQQTNIPVGELE